MNPAPPLFGGGSRLLKLTTGVSNRHFLKPHQTGQFNQLNLQPVFIPLWIPYNHLKLETIQNRQKPAKIVQKPELGQTDTRLPQPDELKPSLFNALCFMPQLFIAKVLSFEFLQFRCETGEPFIATS